MLAKARAPPLFEQDPTPTYEGRPDEADPRAARTVVAVLHPARRRDGTAPPSQTRAHAALPFPRRCPEPRLAAEPPFLYLNAEIVRYNRVMSGAEVGQIFAYLDGKDLVY